VTLYHQYYLIWHYKKYTKYKNGSYWYKDFVEMENIARKFRLQTNQEKTKYMTVERKSSLKKNKIGHLKIKNYKFERVENF